MAAKYTEARKQANKRWDEANKHKYKRINLILHAEIGEQVKHAAEVSGQSVTQWITDAIMEKL